MKYLLIIILLYCLVGCAEKEHIMPMITEECPELAYMVNGDVYQKIAEVDNVWENEGQRLLILDDCFVQSDSIRQGVAYKTTTGNLHLAECKLFSINLGGTFYAGEVLRADADSLVLDYFDFGVVSYMRNPR